MLSVTIFQTYERKDEAGELIRRGAEVTLTMLDDAAQLLRERHLLGPGMEEIAADPVLNEGSLRAIRATIGHWLTSTLKNPWEPVGPAVDDDSVRMARDLVRRGLGNLISTAYRVAQTDSWRGWIAIITSLTDDPELIRIVLDRTAESMGAFHEANVQAIEQVVQQERADLRRGGSWERREMVDLLLDGAPVALERASSTLGMDLTRPHTAAVVWAHGPERGQGTLEAVVDLLARRPHLRPHVCIFPSSGLAWVWVDGPSIDDKVLEHELRRWPDMRVAIGEPGKGAEGFRASHRSALAVQRLLSQSALRQTARADETRLVALLAKVGDDARDFARNVLGELTEAPEEVLLTVRTYLAELGSVNRTAERLYAHRNTIMRRLEKADALLPHPVAERPLDVAAALELWQWLGPEALSPDPAASGLLVGLLNGGPAGVGRFA